MKKINLNKKEIVVFIILVLLSIMAIIFVNNNASFYKKTIVKVVTIKTTKETSSSNNLGLTENYYIQHIKGLVMNGKNRGKRVTLDNEITTSSVVSETYKVGDYLFVDLDKSSITGLKRDSYVTFMIVLFVISIFIVGRFRGLCTTLSVILNTIIFYIGLDLYFKGINLLLLCMLESILFTTFSILIASGKNKMSFSAIISVFISITILFIMTFSIAKLSNYRGISFNGMSFITVPVLDVFLAEVMIGGLGAIMDVSITMSSSVNELLVKDKTITNKALIKSGREIGKDIMGTMINVLFFNYLCSGLPIFVLALRNGFSLYNYISTNFTLEATRFLVGSIGIVITIPIGLFVAVKMLKEGVKYE